VGHVTRLFLLTGLVSLAGCGDRTKSEDSANQNSRLGYYDDYGWANGSGTGANPNISALGGGPLGTLGDSIEGSGQNGSLSAAETQQLLEAVGNLSSSDKNQLNSVLLNYLRQCSFPPAGASTVASCRAGNGMACARTIAGYANGYLDSMAERMGLSSADMAYLNAEMAMCGAVDVGNPETVQPILKSKADSCKQGNRRACGGLLMILAKMFMRALGMALNIIQSKIPTITSIPR
jgi:hypothetical protein